MAKKLYKSSKNKMISGVCAGIAEYFNIDPSIVRLIWAFAALWGGTGVVAYIICAIVLPSAPAGYPHNTEYNGYDSNRGNGPR